ncbi:hypothetical protein [Halorientalis halophila]|uniref:hypothetical protein n=1 Tax=Halorientalis halophila TaxID=3108499 RepID=UPI003008472D
MERFAPVTIERFVRAVVAGGLALVAGLWLTALFARGTTVWLLGLVLVLCGLLGLGWGIRSELDT